MKTISEIMTKDPVCCVPSDTVEQAARLMKREDIGPIPVVADDRSKKLVAIVTDRDLTLKVIAEGRDPRTTKVEEVMTRDPVTCRENDDFESVVKTMARHQIRRIPVVDDKKCIIGIVAQADVATRADAPEQTAKLVEEVSE